jgi:hypothetical protein
MCDIASPNLAKPMTAKESKNQSMALVQIAFWRALARRIQTLDVQK